MSNSRSLAKLPAFLSPAGVLSPQAGGTGVTSLNAAVGALGLTIGTDVQAYDADLGSIAGLTGTAGLLKKTATNTWTLDTSTYLTGITSGQVTSALGFTPYNATNPSGYISGITSTQVTTALGFTPYNSTNPSGYTNNTGTVTSVAGTGTVSGLTLSGTISTTGNLTLGGTLSLTSGNVTTALGYTPENSANRGVANGYASLDGSGLVPSGQLPSYVDDVIEYANLAAFPATNVTGKIFVALDTNKTYRWSGSAYVYITSGAVDSVAGKTGVVSLVSSDVGLGNVENKSSTTIRSEISSANVTTALGFTPYNATNPSGYTSNTGTVTSVAGTGTVSGLTLSGTVSTTGSLTLGGSLSLTSGQVTGALGFTPYNATNPSGYITGITSGNVTTALGFTPYNATNPSGYITSSALSGYLTTSTAASTYLPLTGGTLTGAVNASGTSGSVGGYFGTIKIGYNANYGTIERTDTDLYLQVNNAYNVVVGSGGGYLLASNSSRAPIFYDSGDTSYYIDPAGTSYLSAVRINTHLYSSYNSNNILLRTSTGSTNSSGLLVQNIDGYFRFQLYGDGSAYGFLGTNWGGWDLRKVPSGNLFLSGENTYYYGSTEAYLNRVYGTTDIRSPVYYDNDDTGYYLNAAGTSNLDRIAVVRSGQNVYTDANYGYGLVGAYSSTRYQGVYAMGDSYKLTSDGTGVGTLYGIAWAHPNAGGQAANLASHGMLILENGTFKGAWGGGSLRTPTDVRAPIIYDLDDTGYYVNPNGSSSVSSIIVNDWFRTTGQIGLYSNSYGQHFYPSSSVGYMVMASPTASYGAIVYKYGYEGAVKGYTYWDGSGFGLLHGGGGWSVRGNLSSVGGQFYGSWFSDTDLRAPIFYDHNNTGYYLDLNGSANASMSCFGAWYYTSNYNTGSGSSPPLQVYSSGGNGAAMAFHRGGYYAVNMGLDSDNVMRIGGWSAPSSLWQLDMSGNEYLAGSSRAPIFYDYNDTSYYVDPNSGSRLAHIFAGNVASSNDGGWNARFNLVGSAHARMDVVSNSDGIMTTMYSHTGQGVGRVGTYSNHPLTLMAQGGAEGGRVYSGSLRAPVFYDLDDTSYYIDPNSTGDTALRMRGGALFGPNTTWGAYLAVGGNGNISTSYASVAATNGNLHMDAASGCDMYLNYYAGNAVRAYGTFYSTFMYDLNDTGYYVNPNGTSVMNAVNVNSLNIGGVAVTAGGGGGGDAFSAF